MKIPLKGIAASFLLSAAFLTQLTSLSYGMDEDGSATGFIPTFRSPHEILAESSFISLDAADRECSEIAANFLGKSKEMARKIEELGIPALEAGWREVLKAIKATADVDDEFNLLGSVPSEAATFLAKQQEGKTKKAQWEIACLRSQTYQREAAEANMLFEFFRQATNPLSILVALKDAIITKEMLTSTSAQVPYYVYGGPFSQSIQDTPALAFIAGLDGDGIYLDFDNFTKRLPARANQADILSSLRDLPKRIQAVQAEINAWLKLFPTIWEINLKGLTAAQTQQSILTAVEVPVDASFKDVDEHKRKLLAASRIVMEKQGIINIMTSLKEFLDKTKGYLRKNSKVT